MTDHYRLLTNLLASTLNVAPESISPQSTPVQLGLDSLALVELAVILETDHGLYVADPDEALTMPLSEFADQLALARPEGLSFGHG